MSMIGKFDLISRTLYEELLDAINKNDNYEKIIQKIIHQMQDSQNGLHQNNCSGEVYLAMFMYLKYEMSVDFYLSEKFIEIWKKVTGDNDILFITSEHKDKYKEVLNSLNHTKLNLYINDFYMQDFGDKGTVALNNFIENMSKTEEELVLIYQLN